MQRYIDHVNELVVRWQKADPNPPKPAAAPAAATSAPATAGGPTVAQLQLGLFEQSFQAVGAQFRPDWSFHQYAFNEARAGRFLGSPLGESRRITVAGAQYSVQVFALDTHLQLMAGATKEQLLAAIEGHVLARRMGIMYIIWNDHIYSSYDQFERRDYLSSSCKTRRSCSKTLRHRDHMHISITRKAARAETSFYLARLAQTD